MESDRFSGVLTFFKIDERIMDVFDENADISCFELDERKQETETIEFDRQNSYC